MNENTETLELPPPWNVIFPLATRIIVWSILISVIYLLRSFFLLVLLTFVFGYTQSNGVRRLERLIPSRPGRVVLVAVVFLGLIVGISLFVFPKVHRQAQVFVSQYSVYVHKVDVTLLNLGKSYPFLHKIIPELEEMDASSHQDDNGKLIVQGKSPTATFLQELAGFGKISEGYRNLDNILTLLGDIGGRFASIASAFLLALLFSFLIVLDLPKLSESVKDLRNTHIRFIYDEVSDNIYEFSHVLGQALEVQFYIALINTILTAIGIYFLGLGKAVAFLSVIVFFCSFIPVAGVFISSVPICLMALQTEGGLTTVLLAILLITVIHLIEGYILNPRIYGSRMHINPVIVLIILTISGKLFHFWGLILGVPVATYFFGHAIRYEKQFASNSPEDGGNPPELSEDDKQRLRYPAKS